MSTTRPVHRIADKKPQYPCWMWHRTMRSWWRCPVDPLIVEGNFLEPDDLWSPDAPTPPPQQPGQEGAKNLPCVHCGRTNATECPVCDFCGRNRYHLDSAAPSPTAGTSGGEPTPSGITPELKAACRSVGNLAGKHEQALSDLEAERQFSSQKDEKIATLERECSRLQQALQRAEGERARWREHDDRQLESDSIVASCGCLTKTNEVRFHKPGCKYRLICERDDARKALAEACDWAENRLAVEGHPIPASMSLLVGWRKALK